MDRARCADLRISQCAACSLFPVACSLFPVACCLLPVACCLLPAASPSDVLWSVALPRGCPMDSGRTGARSAVPTGLLHVALLLPVDAVASSRPSWSWTSVRAAGPRISGR
ncbi:hypothetical protein FM103_16960 [Corynebacterium xerosis]|nr:hypothetical protein FM103_16960 [Corynebacterium xerosis]